ncbi:MAG: hypothetical protein ABEH65_01955 [Halobacteriales archaeon]
MIEDRVTDGKRIAQLLASELDGREDGDLNRIAVDGAEPDAEPSSTGTRAYDIMAEGAPIATVYIQPDRARIEFNHGVERALETATEQNLRARPAATDPPRTLVFVDDGGAVKRAVAVVVAAAAD